MTFTPISFNVGSDDMTKTWQVSVRVNFQSFVMAIVDSQTSFVIQMVY